MKRKGFTLTELIVVMVIIGILAVFGGLKYLNYTKEAQLTKIKSDISVLEDISMVYYMKHNDWPRLSDEPYTSEQIDEYSKNIRDKTGSVIVLEEGGNYYDIDYTKLSNYIKEPEKSYNYILQNPVGNVFFIEGISEEGKNRIPSKENSNNYDLKEYSSLIYVDAVSGNDDIGDGTINKPYKSLNIALQYIEEGGAIYLEEGVYQVNSLLDIHNKYDVDILGQGLGTVIEVNRGIYLNQNVKNRFFKLVIQPSSSFVNISSTVSGLVSGNSSKRITYDLEYNNILFRDPYNKLVKGRRHTTYIIGDHSRLIEHNYVKFDFNNCVAVDVPMVSVWSDYNDGRVKPNVKITNSATNVPRIDCPNNEYGLGYAHDILIKTSTLEGATFDSNYNITSGTSEDIGLYSGDYSW